MKNANRQLKKLQKTTLNNYTDGLEILGYAVIRKKVARKPFVFICDTDIINSEDPKVIEKCIKELEQIAKWLHGKSSLTTVGGY